MVLLSVSFDMLAAGLLAGQDPTGALIAGITIIVGLGVVTYVLKHFVFMQRSVMCVFCGHHRTESLADLSRRQVVFIMSYYRQYEKRQLNRGRVQVCQLCGVVYDDFFAGKDAGQSATAPSVIGAELPDGLRGYWAHCKLCGELMYGIAKVGLDVECQSCRALHKWQLWREWRFAMLMPPKGSTICDSPKVTGSE